MQLILRAEWWERRLYLTVGTANLMYFVITAAFLTLGDNFWYTGADSVLKGPLPPTLNQQFLDWAKII